jgi:hypothetical protein
MRAFLFLTLIALLFSSCSPLQPESTSTQISKQQPLSTSTETSEVSLVATEQAKAAAVKTRSASTMSAQPTFTPQPTSTLTPANLPTLTPVPNSTPAGLGAFMDVPSDVLGSKYEIQNAYYFDEPKTGERYEFYAGALAGSGGEETAQGVMVLQVLRFSEKAGNAEIIRIQEYQTPIQAGPLRMQVSSVGSILLFTPLHFEWAFLVLHGEMIDLGNPPLARLEIGQESWLAGRGGYCWRGTCADFGIYTNSEPIVVGSPFTAHLHLPLVEPPDVLKLYTMQVSPPGSLEYETVSDLGASWSAEESGRESLDRGGLLLNRDQDIKLSLEPGYYVLTIFAAWRDYGDVQYGFLIEVQE